MNLKELIQMHEGLRLSSYQCPSGDWTIGWGHNLTAHDEPEQGVITLSQADAWLEQDIAEAAGACQMLIPNFELLDEVRQAVLIDMCFNMGAATLSKFDIMLSWLQLGNYEQVARAMKKSLWAQQVPRRAERLIEMMRTGEWPL